MLQLVFDDLDEKMKKVIESLQVCLSRIRTGRANPSLLDPVLVDYHGSKMPINQLANIGVEEGRTLVITPWEKKVIHAIEKAISAANLGLNPSSTGELIRVPLPPLTEETRREMTKTAKSECETAKVSTRNLRRDANTAIKALLKDKKISEDEDRKAQDKVQKTTDQFILEIDKIFQKKEKELIEV
jgi:ribosome recycling factor